jgi:hypothetical protein
VLGTLTIPATGSRFTYTTTSTTLTGIGNVRGPHTVYLVFDAPTVLYTFQLTRA